MSAIPELEQFLRGTLKDGALSRGERKVLRETVAERAGAPEAIEALRKRAFAIAREELVDPRDRAVVEWVEEVVGALLAAAAPRRAESREPSAAWFSPEDDCVGRILELVRAASRTLDVCVFTITDDRVKRELERAHGRGVRIRIVSDDDKAQDEGSDVHDLARAGIPVAFDASEHHMHHKFAIADGRTLLSGSYNWTRSAANYNRENFLVTGDAVLVARYQAEFDRLWSQFAN